MYWGEGQDQDRLVQPGDNVEMMCDLHKPVALEPGQRFNVREGGMLMYQFGLSYEDTNVVIGRTVATGLVTRVYDA